MNSKVTQDDVSKLYADIFNQMKEAVADAEKLGKAAKFELAECKQGNNINDILINLCVVDAAKRLGVAEKVTDDKEIAALAKDFKQGKKEDFHVVTIPCPVLVKTGTEKSDDKYANLDTANMVRIAAEVYQIANADKGQGKAKVHKHALNFAHQGQSALLKP